MTTATLFFRGAVLRGAVAEATRRMFAASDTEFQNRSWREAQAAARQFSKACASGDVEGASLALGYLMSDQVDSDAWRFFMMRAAELRETARPEIQSAFLYNAWIPSKGPSLKVGKRRVLADALRVLMPGGYGGPPMRLYRGTSWRERRRRLYGFSWSRDKEQARRFAEKRVLPSLNETGVILETLAPPQAILLVRDDEEYYDEREVVVDPFRLGHIAVAERVVSVARHNAVW